MGSEIITVQLGNFANFVGSHYWNIQDEAIGCSEHPDWSSVASTVNSEVVCAWSEDRYGDTCYRPRTVVVDLSGSLGGVSFDRTAGSSGHARADPTFPSNAWAGGVHVQQAPAIAKSKYRQQLEDAGIIVEDPDDPDQLDAQQQALEAAAAELHDRQQAPRYWTDLLQVDLADSCVLSLSGAWQGQLGWDGWGVSGSSSSAVRDLVEAAVDRVRWWAEQCDRMQGLQVMADDSGGWGGICHDVLQQLQDQYPSQPLLYFSLQQQLQQAPATTGIVTPGLSPAQVRRLLSNSLSLCEIPQLASLYVPLDAGGHAASAPHSSSFHTAALLAAAIDTVTLPLRCTGTRSAAGAALGATDMHSLVHLLSGPAANLAAAALQLPAANLPSSSTEGAMQAADNRIRSSGLGCLSLSSVTSSGLTPGVQVKPEQCLAESLTLRGARTSPAAALCTTAQAKQALDSLCLQRQQQALDCRCVVHSCVSPMPLAAPLSFPAALLPAHVAAGSRAGAATPAAATGPYLPRSVKAPSVPAPGAFSRLTATSGFEPVLQKAARDLQRLGAYSAGRACLEEWGYSGSDLLELQENLLGMASRYTLDLD